MRNIFSKLILTFVIAIALGGSVHGVLAQTDGCAKLRGQFEAFSGDALIGMFPEHCTIEGALLTVIRFALVMVGVVAVVFIIIGGFQYMTAAGDPKKAETALGTVRSAAIGLVVVLCAVTLVTIVVRFVTGNGGGSGNGNPPGDDNGGTATTTVESLDDVANRITYTISKGVKDTLDIGGETVSTRVVKATVSGLEADLDRLCGGPDNDFYIELGVNGESVQEGVFEKASDTAWKAVISSAVIIPDPPSQKVEIDLQVCGTLLPGPTRMSLE